MINLLPPEEKEKLALNKKKKVTIIFWFLVFFFTICLFLVLIFVKNSILTQVEIQKTLLSETEKESKGNAIKEIEKNINFMNSELIKLNSFYQKKVYFSDIIERISKTLPSNVYLNNFSIVFSPAKKVKNEEEKKEETEEASLQISLSGYCPDRETLFEFKRNLEREKDFKKIFFPPTNWVKATDVEFSVNFEILLTNKTL